MSKWDLEGLLAQQTSWAADHLLTQASKGTGGQIFLCPYGLGGWSVSSVSQFLHHIP